MSFLGGKTPKPAPAPVVPTQDNTQAIQDEAARKAAEQARLRGRSSTVLNGGGGLQESGDVTSSRLLGI